MLDTRLNKLNNECVYRIWNFWNYQDFQTKFYKTTFFLTKTTKFVTIQTNIYQQVLYLCEFNQHNKILNNNCENNKQKEYLNISKILKFCYVDSAQFILDVSCFCIPL